MWGAQSKAIFRGCWNSNIVSLHNVNDVNALSFLTLKYRPWYIPLWQATWNPRRRNDMTHSSRRAKDKRLNGCISITIHDRGSCVKFVSRKIHVHQKTKTSLWSFQPKFGFQSRTWKKIYLFKSTKHNLIWCEPRKHSHISINDITQMTKDRLTQT